MLATEVHRRRLRSESDRLVALRDTSKRQRSKSVHQARVTGFTLLDTNALVWAIEALDADVRSIGQELTRMESRP